MSNLNRQKVEFDPLSFFAEDAVKKLDDEPEPEPEPEPVSVPVREEKKPGPREVKFSDPVPIPVPVPVPVVKEQKVSVAKVEEPKPVKKEETLDELFSSEYNKKTELLLNSAEDIFATESISPKSGDGSKGFTASDLKGAINYRKTDDDDISDLKVAQLLEREDGLDDNIFGKYAPSTAQKIVQKKKLIAELDTEQNFLKELDDITISKPKFSSNLSRSNDSTSPKLTTSTIQEKKVDIDLNSFDINSYINQEASSSGGGLFD